MWFIQNHVSKTASVTLRDNAIKTGSHCARRACGVRYRVKISGFVSTVCIRWLSLALGLGVALVPPAASQSLSRLTGDYVCAYGCRLTDANLSIVVKGGEVY